MNSIKEKISMNSIKEKVSAAKLQRPMRDACYLLSQWALKALLSRNVCDLDFIMSDRLHYEIRSTKTIT